jgi:histidinol phosphatase-like PHP family hydrolase
MKVYELMKELSDMPAGAEVKFHTLEEKDNMEEYDDDTYEIDYEIKSVEFLDDSIQLCNFE